MVVTLYVTDRSLYLMRSLILSNWKEFLIWEERPTWNEMM